MEVPSIALFRLCVGPRKLSQCARAAASHCSHCENVLHPCSMDDCESVCDRIAIMSDGRLQCLGSLQRLKDRFGGGCTLVLRLAPTERLREKEVHKSIQQVFAGAKLKDYTEGVFKFHLLQKLRWSEVFARVNELQRCYSFEHAFVSDCSLEEIFVDIARGRHQCISPVLLSSGTPKK
ncbi:hypothetical protein HPB49_003301 [Dermacentor silvarum]|uniref:Uncharacterized protein n=1 Tax=Dermacentor silvarum TaxID=543639 RepID=A0ACB8DAB2_DERSI|nr:hypothetical protein HPB49_003301 [Dermacentor silvarum]